MGAMKRDPTCPRLTHGVEFVPAPNGFVPAMRRKFGLPNAPNRRKYCWRHAKGFVAGEGTMARSRFGPAPNRRPLRVYAFDPSRGKRLGNEMQIDVRYR